MTTEEFFRLLSDEVQSYKKIMETKNHDWTVKGFIDIDKNIYTITNDTKVVSKLIEILLIPRLEAFANKNGLKIEFPSKQNFYPDLTFSDDNGHLFAVDFKSSYYNDKIVNAMTLGSYWGYFRERDSSKNMDHTYNSYASHLVLGILYKKSSTVNERSQYSIDELDVIHSVIEDFIFFVQPKWKIASDIPGSGNTRNIGAITNVDDLTEGKGVFAELGEEVFDDYWQNYFNKTDARTCGIGKSRYHNLETYRKYLKLQAKKFSKLESK